MEHRYITLSGTALAGQDVWTAFDAQLQAALLANVAGVAVGLAPQMPADIQLLDWLEGWQKEFTEVGKEFIIVAEDARHVQCLEISHPDQNLRYVSSMEELWRVFPVYRPAGPAAAEPEKPPAPMQTQPAPVPAPPPVAAPLQPHPQYSALHQPPPQIFEYAPPDTPPTARVRAGELIRASGEYACLGCATTRMYAKGDRATACGNAECQGPVLGWKLIFELF